jgi:hypothetical protein
MGVMKPQLGSRHPPVGTEVTVPCSPWGLCAWAKGLKSMALTGSVNLEPTSLHVARLGRAYLVVAIPRRVTLLILLLSNHDSEVSW